MFNQLYLEVLPEDIDQWVTKSREWREKYDDLKNTVSALIRLQR